MSPLRPSAVRSGLVLDLLGHHRFEPKPVTLGMRRLQNPQWHFQYALSNMSDAGLEAAAVTLRPLTDPWARATLVEITREQLVRRLR